MGLNLLAVPEKIRIGPRAVTICGTASRPIAARKADIPRRSINSPTRSRFLPLSAQKSMILAIRALAAS